MLLDLLAKASLEVLCVEGWLSGSHSYSRERGKKALPDDPKPLKPVSTGLMEDASFSEPGFNFTEAARSSDRESNIQRLLQCL